MTTSSRPSGGGDGGEHEDAMHHVARSRRGSGHGEHGRRVFPWHRAPRRAAARSGEKDDAAQRCAASVIGGDPAVEQTAVSMMVLPAVRLISPLARCLRASASATAAVKMHAGRERLGAASPGYEQRDDDARRTSPYRRYPPGLPVPTPKGCLPGWRSPCRSPGARHGRGSGPASSLAAAMRSACTSGDAGIEQARLRPGEG